MIDLNAEVCPDSYLEDAIVSTGSDIYKSRLTRSWADHAKVVNSIVDNSKLSGVTVYDAAVFNSEIRNADIRGAGITNCDIRAGHIGAAILDGLTVVDDIRIGTGTWTRLPRYFRLDDGTVSGVYVTESTDGCSYIGCQRKPMLTWIKGKRRFGKAIGWSPATLDLIEEHFREWLSHPSTSS